MLLRTDALGTFMKGFADVVRLPPPKRRPADIVPILEDVVALLQPVAKNRGIAFRLDVRDRLEDIPIDRGQIEQVLVNVLKNAMEAIGRDGTITLRTERNGARKLLVVEDTGPGISPEARAQLFRPFFTTKENGQGLGLTLVREILLQHGFEFSLESARRGRARGSRSRCEGRIRRRPAIRSDSALIVRIARKRVSGVSAVQLRIRQGASVQTLRRRRSAEAATVALVLRSRRQDLS